VSIPSRLANQRPIQLGSDIRPNDIRSNDIIPNDPPDLFDNPRPTRETAGAGRDTITNTAANRPPDSPDIAVIPGAPVPVFNDAPMPAPVASTATVETIPVEAASDSPAAFKLSVNVSLAQVDTLVRDRNGRPIANLTASDFRLFEDGVERPIQTFSRDQLPLAVALVIDRSTSVAPAMREIQNAAYTALAQLKEGDEACLFAFAENVQRLEDLTPDRQRVANRIGSISGGGGTNIVTAVYAALRYLEDNAPDRRRAVILISDNANGLNDMNVDTAIRLAHQSETVVYNVKIDPARFALPNIFGQAPAPFSIGGNPVPDLTKESGGEIFDAARLGSIERAMATAVERLKTRYTIGYTPSSEDTRESHRIEIRLVDRFGKPDSDYTVLSRTTNYAIVPQNPTRNRR
jgi:VWFA-related protein